MKTIENLSNIEKVELHRLAHSARFNAKYLQNHPSTGAKRDKTRSENKLKKFAAARGLKYDEELLNYEFGARHSSVHFSGNAWRTCRPSMPYSEDI